MPPPSPSVNQEPIDASKPPWLYFGMSYNKISIFRTGALGDVILTLPVIHNLHKAFPNAQINLIGNPNLLALAKADHTEIHDINRAIWAPLFAPESTISKDLYALFQGTDLTLSYLPDPGLILTQNLQRLGVSHTVTCPPRPNTQTHAIDHLLGPLQSLNIPTPESHPRISLTKSERQNLSTNSTSSPTLLIHPGSGGKNKCWPPEFFASVADRIVRKTGCKITLSSGPADGNLAEQVAQFMTEEATLLPQSSIRHFAAFMTACTAYLGNDSGPTHLAAAMGLPTIALFGPTNPQQWAPRGPSTCTIQSPSHDMRALSPEQVYPHLHTQLTS